LVLLVVIGGVIPVGGLQGIGRTWVDVGPRRGEVVIHGYGQDSLCYSALPKTGAAAGCGHTPGQGLEPTAKNRNVVYTDLFCLGSILSLVPNTSRGRAPRLM